MGNIAFIDESASRKLYIFSAIVLSGNDVAVAVRNELDNCIQQNKASLGGSSFKRIHAVNIPGGNLGRYNRPLQEMFEIIVRFAKRKQAKVVYYIFHRDNINMGGIDFGKVIENVLSQVTVANSNEIQQMLYDELNIWLIKNLNVIPITGHYIEKMIVDDKHNLLRKTSIRRAIKGSIGALFKTPQEFVARVIEIGHNTVNRTKQHNGLREISYSKMHPSVWVADILANFLLNSIRYMYLDSINSLEKSTYQGKFSFLQNIVDLSSFPLASLNLAAEIEPHAKFTPINGEIG